jgi:choline dehydrogenase
LFDKSNRATTVVFEKNGKMKEVKARREIILSAGSIGTPAILMRSGIGPGQHLRDLKVNKHYILPAV